MTRYDIVITDIRMPGINGLKLYQILKAIDPNVRVLFSTALEIDDEIKVLELDPGSVLKKPIGRSQLLQHVWKTLELKLRS